MEKVEKGYIVILFAVRSFSERDDRALERALEALKGREPWVEKVEREWRHIMEKGVGFLRIYTDRPQVLHDKPLHPPFRRLRIKPAFYFQNAVFTLRLLEEWERYEGWLAKVSGRTMGKGKLWEWMEKRMEDALLLFREEALREMLERLRKVDIEEHYQNLLRFRRDIVVNQIPCSVGLPKVYGERLKENKYVAYAFLLSNLFLIGGEEMGPLWREMRRRVERRLRMELENYPELFPPFRLSYLNNPGVYWEEYGEIAGDEEDKVGRKVGEGNGGEALVERKGGGKGS